MSIVIGATKQGWIDSLSTSLAKKLPQEHQYRICQLITIVVRHVRQYVGEDAPSDRYVRKKLPTKYKVEYRVKNALKSSGTSSANYSKGLVEESPGPAEVTEEATIYGNHCHVIVPLEWRGKKIRCIINE